MAIDLLHILLQWVHKINPGFMQRWKISQNHCISLLQSLNESLYSQDCGKVCSMILSIWCKVPHVTSSDAIKYWIWCLRCGTGVQAFDSCMWSLRYQVYGIWGCYLDFLWVGRKEKNREESNLHMGIGQEAPPKTISLPITIPKGNLFSTQLYLATRTLWTQQCTLTITWKIGHCESLGIHVHD